MKTKNSLVKEVLIYVHIPFCISKCRYCDFPSFCNKEGQYEDYVSALINEMEQTYSLYKDKIVVKTCYIGGGTPTILPMSLMEKIMNTINKFSLVENCEISIEANPETLSYEYLDCLKKLGINRISMGLQSTDNEILKSIGRAHTFEKFYEEYNNCVKVGFDNINVDLMFSLPKQTLEIYNKTLDIVTDLAPSHISAYSLIIEENTPMYQDYIKDRIALPDEDLDRELYLLTNEKLEKAGYNRYEISNYCKDNKVCNHNLNYWLRTPYFGFGLGSHSFMNDKRYNNTRVLEKYIDGGNVVENILPISKTQAMEEFMFLGLRIKDGVLINEFKALFGEDMLNVFGSEIQELIDGCLLKNTGKYLKLTDKGVDLSNYVFGKFIK